MLNTIKETVSFIGDRTDFSPETGIILGTGLGKMVDEIHPVHVFVYGELPNFPVSTVESHNGKLIFGMLNGKKVVAMQGRFHYYEGYDMKQVTFPVRVMKYLGVSQLFVSNAGGGLHPDFSIGDLMIINDHINLMPNPLIGKHEPELGPRFPDMSEPYDPKMIAMAGKIAAQNNIRIHQGCYVGLTGPTLETPMEYHFLRTIGGDAVGMSTVPEIIVARQMDIRCFAISIITDIGIPGKLVHVTIEDVKRAAEKAEPKMTLIMKKLIASF